MSDDGHHPYRRSLLLSGGLVLCGYLLGLLFPETFWATNNPGLLPALPALLLWLGAALLFSSAFWRSSPPGLLPDLAAMRKTHRNLLFVLIALAMAGIYAAFPMPFDPSGDAMYIRTGLDIHIPEWDSRLLSEPLQPDWFNSKVGLLSYYQVNNLIAWATGMSGLEAARMLGFLLGGIFAYSWMRFVDLYLSGSGWKWLFILVGLSTPLTQVYMGHYETYAMSYTAIILWFSALGVYFKSESGRWLIALPFLFLLVLQTHITNWLLFPTLAAAVLWHFGKGAKGAPTWWNWRNAARFYLLPALLLGGVAYFFILQNHDGPRSFSEEGFEEALFLPLRTAEPAPLDRYNLFSPAHLLDYLNMLYMWSGALLLLLIPPLTFLRRKVPWNEPMILLTGTTALLMTGAFFVLNPLLSAATDWDLFASPGMVALPFAVAVYGRIGERLRLRYLAGPVAALCLLSASFLMVNSGTGSMARRLMLMGKHSFKTYWIGSSSDLENALNLIPDDETRRRTRQELIAELEAWAVERNDSEYAALLYSEGKYLREIRRDLRGSVKVLEQAYHFEPTLGDNLWLLTLNYAELGDSASAFRYCDQAAQLRYQPYKRSLRMAVELALAAGEYQKAANYAVTYLNRWQDDPLIAEAERRLRTGDRVKEIIRIFR